VRSLTILQLNDLHGCLTPHPELFRLAPNDRFRSGGGVARIATIFQSIRREVDGALIALDNGDTFHGTMPAVCTEGEALLGNGKRRRPSPIS
jgi:2',3'-cyclic-nucleotide 2'-phosphodiesterase (5'-nucleotidase family)